MSEPSLADMVHEAVERAKADEERRPVTLTEFLLARIAEDEALLTVPTAKRMIGRKMVQVPMTRLPDYVERDRARWAAECEAKRRIVEHAKSATNGHVKLTAVQHCTWLAQPYAEHPDFDPSWRL